MKRDKKTAIFVASVFAVFFCLFSNALPQDIQLERVLQSDYDLTPKYQVGDKDFYHIRTAYLEMNDSGKVANTRVLDGHFSREVLRFEGSKRYDRFRWKEVKKGEREGKGQITAFKVLPYSQDFQYEFSLEDMTPEHFPVDVTSIPKTMEGYQFFVKLIDAHTFDVLSNPASYDHRFAKIGETAIIPQRDLRGLIDFPPLFTDTNFAQAPIFTTFQGITLHQNEPCAILAFRSDDSQIHMVANMMDMKIPSEATSSYWGDIFVSLESGKLLRGTLYEDVVSLASLGPKANPVRNVIRREITLEKINAEP